MPRRARYPLQEVLRLVDEKKGWFSARPRSTLAVTKAYEGSTNPKSQDEAEAFIWQGIRSLTDAHYCESVLQWGDPKCIADVYGIIFDGRPWYVKFRINDEEGLLEEISFHPPEKEMRTVSGMVIPKGVTNYEK
jgi:hypothetical protein